MDGDYIVCTCMIVMRSQLMADIESGKIKTIADAAREHGIGTGCKSCVCEVQEMIQQCSKAAIAGCCNKK